MSYSISENTRYDSAAQKSVPYSWTLRWGLYTNAPHGNPMEKIAGQERRAFAIPAQPESHIKTAEMSTEQNYNMIDGMMNNAPSMEELEARAKAGEQISLLDVAEAAKAEAKKPKQTRKTTQKQKKPSIRAQLAAAKEEQKKKPPAREKSKEMEV